MKLMQTQTLAKVKAKIGKRYQITGTLPRSDHPKLYTLEGGSAGVASR
jgi:hypothetical protein